MKFFVCPRCACVNKAKNEKCEGCGVPTLMLMLIPNVQWLEFESVHELDKWLRMAKERMGFKLWRG